MKTEKLSTFQSNIYIRKIEYEDFKQVADLYYRYLSGDFVGSCGERMFLNYLEYLYNIWQGSLICAVNQEQRVIGFSVGIIDRKQINRQWLRYNLMKLVPLLMARLLFSKSFRSAIHNRIRNKLQGGGGFDDTSKPNKNERKAFSMWVAVDESYRAKGDHVAARLLMSIEKDVKDKGASQIYGFVNRSNLASIFMHLKNGWKVVDKNKKRFKLAKELD